MTLGMQLSIHAEKMSEIRRIRSNVKCARLIDDLTLFLGHAFLHQKILGPGGVQHFHPVTIRPAKIFVQAPAESAVS